MGESHIVHMPKGFLAVRILQIVFALMVVGLTAFLISNTIGGVYGATGFGIFCGIITLIIVTYDLVSERAAQAAYNMWAVLALDIVMVVFWLSAMGALASLRAAFTVPIVVKRSLVERDYLYAWATNSYLAILAAAAGVAAIEFILFLISLIMFSARLHRHRNASKISHPGAGNIHVSPDKIELQQNNIPQQHYNAAPAQAYPNYQPPAMQPQPSGSTTFSPISPMHTGQQNPYQPTMTPPPQGYPTPTTSPPPQFAQPTPQYPVSAPPQGYHEVSAMRQTPH